MPTIPPLRTTRRFLVGAVALAAIGVLAACGGGTAGDAAGGNGSGSQSGSVTVHDVTGTVKLAKPAKRVVALEWNYVEDLLTLGVTPVGVGDAGTYDQWVGAGKRLPKSVTDVGTRAQPSLEKIKALNPDLIVVEKSRVSANLGQLKDIAPVVEFDGYSPNDKLVQTVNTSMIQLGTAVGKADTAKQVVARYQQKVADAKKKLAGKATDIALLQGFSVDGQPSIRAYTAHSQAVQVLESIGLTNAWHGKDSDPSGFTATGVEGLTQVSDATVLYIAQPSDNPFTGALAKNATWKNLGFVKQHKLHGIDPGTWVWGGPKSNEMLIDQALSALGAA